MIVVLGKEAETRPDLAQTFVHKHRTNGMTEVCSADETAWWLINVSSWASGSETAGDILAVVHDWKEPIYVVGMRGGFQCFAPEQGNGVIYVDVRAQLGVRVRGPHGETVTRMHNYIATLHEFGHAKQWIEHRLFFEGGYLADSIFERQLQDAATARWEKTVPAGLNYRAKRKFLSNILPDQPASKKGWAVRVETDNLIRHEWPICRELGYPIRQYTDLVSL